MRYIRSEYSAVQSTHHHRYSQGRQSFEHFRILIAGGGTGFTACHLGARLRHKNPQVLCTVYCVHVHTTHNYFRLTIWTSVLPPWLWLRREWL